MPSRPINTHRPAPPAHHPVVAKELARAEDAQVKVADLITRFAGSMPFVYAHIVLFAGWMLLLERSPWPSLTLIVSLEAIFLSTFVMIGQNRQARFQRAKADHDFLSEEQELRLNTEMTRTIERLVRQIHETVRDKEIPPPSDPAPNLG
ncbi:MAG: DUF1003 domain-containing protein [Nocardioides sp.]|nr:DUF1003 domain-containing protein [Nocardioides sp.]